MASSTAEGATSVISPPEPDLTPKEMIARAVALREKLLAAAGGDEERTYYSQEMHEEFVRAGFYRTYIPRRYGGYEFDVPTYARVLLELARGCPNSAWCMGLAGNHALQIGSWFSEHAQAEIFGDGDFRAASVAMPIGPATRTEGGWELNGKVVLRLGHPVLDALHGAGADARHRSGGPPVPPVRRAEERVDDARRLGQPARPQGERVAERRLRPRPRSRPTGRWRTRS